MNKYSCWYTSDIFRGLNIKQKLYIKYKKYKSSNILTQFQGLRANLKINVIRADENYISRVGNTLIRYPKPTLFWSHVDRDSRRTQIPGIMHYKGQKLESQTDFVDASPDFFGGV